MFSDNRKAKNVRSEDHESKTTKTSIQILDSVPHKDRKSPEGQEKPDAQIELPLVPKEAQLRYGDSLTGYELDEMQDFPQIYFLGQNARKARVESHINSISF